MSPVHVRNVDKNVDKMSTDYNDSRDITGVITQTVVCKEIRDILPEKIIINFYCEQTGRSDLVDIAVHDLQRFNYESKFRRKFTWKL